MFARVSVVPAEVSVALILFFVVISVYGAAVLVVVEVGVVL